MIIMKTKEILPKDIWNEDKLYNVNHFINKHSENQSKDQKIKNKLLAIQYKLEDYIEDDTIKEDEVLDVLDFVKMYLKALDTTKNDLAKYFGMDGGNLHKYLTGKRKLNPEIVLKISSFTHTNPEHWYRIQVKNELVKLKREKIKAYEKYDYRNLLSV